MQQGWQKIALFSSVLLCAGGVWAQGLHLPAETLLSDYWDKGGLPAAVERAPKTNGSADPLIGGISYALDADNHFSVGLGWQPGKTSEDPGHLGAAAASYRHRFEGVWAPVVTAGLSVMRHDRPVGEPVLDSYGAHLSLGLNPAKDWGLSVGLGYRAGIASNSFGYDAVGERGKSLSGDLAAVYRWQRNLEIQGELSGLDLRAPNRDAEFSREIGVRLRYSFE